MSQSIVECPICEGKFMLPPGMSSTLVICPNCNRQVDLAVKLPVAKPASVIPMARPAPSDQVGFGSVVAGPVASRENFASTKPATDVDPITGLPQKIRKKYVPSNRKKKSLAIVWMIIGFLVTIGIIAAIMYNSAPAIDSDDESAKAAETETKTADVPSVGVEKVLAADSNTEKKVALRESTTPGKTTSKSANAEAPAIATTPPKPVDTEAVASIDASVPDPTPIEPPPRPVFSFHSASAVKNCWEKSRPHLVLLKIEDPRGTTYAAGTLVDSRGYVLTSYNAIKDAWEIEVTGARKPLDENQGVVPLKDLARGIVATDAQHDLALLSVNRRFIVSFGSVDVIPNDKIVPGEFLLLCGPPTPVNYYGKAESKVDFRGTVDQLDPQTRQIVESMQLTQSKLPWFRLSNASIALPGTPAFRIDGTLAAMCIFKDGKSAYAVPANLVKALIAGASNEVQMLKPIVRRPDSVNTTGGEPPNATGGATEVTTYLTDKRITDRIGELEQSAARCRQFNWLPTDMLQYTALQQFTRAAGAARDFTVANRAQAEDFATASKELVTEFRSLDTQLKAISKEIHEALKAALAKNYSSIEKVNEFAKVVMAKKSTAPIVFYGELFSSGTAPVFKFEEADTYYQIKNDDAVPVMYAESMWMYFIEIKDEGKPQSFKVPGEDTTIKVIPAEFRMAISPIERP